MKLSVHHNDEEVFPYLLQQLPGQKAAMIQRQLKYLIL